MLPASVLHGESRDKVHAYLICLLRQFSTNPQKVPDTYFLIFKKVMDPMTIWAYFL